MAPCCSSRRRATAVCWIRIRMGWVFRGGADAFFIKRIEIPENAIIKLGKSAASLFSGAGQLTDISDLVRMDPSDTTDMRNMFSGCRGLKSLDGIGSWGDRLGSVAIMSGMFESCTGLESTSGIAGWHTGNAADMSRMFYGCSGLASLDVSGWDTRSVRNASGMFDGCYFPKAVLGYGFYASDAIPALPSYSSAEVEGTWVYMDDPGCAYAADALKAAMRSETAQEGVYVWKPIILDGQIVERTDSIAGINLDYDSGIVIEALNDDGGDWRRHSDVFPGDRVHYRITAMNMDPRDPDIAGFVILDMVDEGLEDIVVDSIMYKKDGQETEIDIGDVYSPMSYSEYVAAYPGDRYPAELLHHGSSRGSIYSYGYDHEDRTFMVFDFEGVIDLESLGSSTIVIEYSGTVGDGIFSTNNVSYNRYEINNIVKAMYTASNSGCPAAAYRPWTTYTISEAITDTYRVDLLAYADVEYPKWLLSYWGAYAYDTANRQSLAGARYYVVASDVPMLDGSAVRLSPAQSNSYVAGTLSVKTGTDGYAALGDGILSWGGRIGIGRQGIASLAAPRDRSGHRIFFHPRPAFGANRKRERGNSGHMRRKRRGLWNSWPENR